MMWPFSRRNQGCQPALYSEDDHDHRYLQRQINDINDRIQGLERQLKLKPIGSFMQYEEGEPENEVIGR